MSTPHGLERRTQALRRSGAAGFHDQRVTRSETERAAVAREDEPCVCATPFTCMASEHGGPDAMEAVDAAEYPTPRNPALDDYLSQWVAVADGEVVAAAPTSLALVPLVKALPEELQRRAVTRKVHGPDDALYAGWLS